MSDYNDAEAAEYYSDPDHRHPSASNLVVPSRASSRLTDYIRVRFSPDLLAKVKVLAVQDGRTVSSWIRAVVSAEVEARSPDQTQTGPMNQAPVSTWETHGTELMTVSG